MTVRTHRRLLVDPLLAERARPVRNWPERDYEPADWAEQDAPETPAERTKAAKARDDDPDQYVDCPDAGKLHQGHALTFIPSIR